MQFNITIDQEPFSLEIEESLMQEAKGFINDMDADLDKGFQLARHWLDKPSDEQKCQMAANKFVNAMHQENIRMVYLMAAYILSKMPALKMVTIDSDYEIDEIDFM